MAGLVVEFGRRELDGLDLSMARASSLNARPGAPALYLGTQHLSLTTKCERSHKLAVPHGKRGRVPNAVEPGGGFLAKGCA